MYNVFCAREVEFVARRHARHSSHSTVLQLCARRWRGNISKVPKYQNIILYQAPTQLRAESAHARKNEEDSRHKSEVDPPRGRARSRRPAERDLRMCKRPNRRAQEVRGPRRHARRPRRFANQARGRYLQARRPVRPAAQSSAPPQALLALHACACRCGLLGARPACWEPASG